MTRREMFLLALFVFKKRLGILATLVFRELMRATIEFGRRRYELGLARNPDND